MSSPDKTRGDGQIDITWLGQAGFLLRSPEVAIAIDPFLSKHELRLYEPPEDEILGNRLDCLLATHEHGDHLDVALLPRLIRRFPDLTVVVPTPVVSKIRSLVPTAKVIGLQPGGSVAVGEVSVRAVSAVHAIAIADGYSDGRQAPGDATPFLGYVLQYGRFSIYHAGDTIASSGLLGELSRLGVDVVILPVNGRDYFRELAGIAGNLTAREAVELAAEAGASMLIPMHHDLIRGNTERAGLCADIVAELQLPIHVLNLARFKPLSMPSRVGDRDVA